MEHSPYTVLGKKVTPLQLRVLTIMKNIGTPTTVFVIHDKSQPIIPEKMISETLDGLKRLKLIRSNTKYSKNVLFGTKNASIRVTYWTLIPELTVEILLSAQHTE